jgi:hypothetical protein
VRILIAGDDRTMTIMNYWEQVESDTTEHSAAHCSHGICPTCYDQKVNDLDTPAAEPIVSPR